MHTSALLLAGLIALIFSAGMLLQKTLYGSAICFLIVLIQIAGAFYILGSPLLAFLQVLVYAGAIMVLIVTAIMASPPRLRGLWSDISLPRPLVVLALLAAAGEAVLLILGGPSAGAEFPAWPTLQADFAAALFGPYALLTEVVGVMILLAALGVVELWRAEA